MTSVAPTTCVAMPPNRAPVPWVPVEMAPEIDWRSMSPRFSIARPYGASSAGTWCRRVPASSVTRDALAVDRDEPGEVGEIEQHAGRDGDAR